MSNVTLTINGREIEAEIGASLLAVALDHGIEIPHFCYHPGIGVEGSCRLCLVEIKGMPKLATSCTVPVEEGMVVFTETEAVKKARKGVLEFFLLNHPLDCPFCDKGGECPLQNYTLDSGHSESRLTFPKIHKAKHQIIGEHILLDKERCVLCNRCVRFGRELAGREELGIRNRGNKCEIFIPEGKSLTTGFTGNYADICPVGALTTRDFRFKARPWEMKTVNTVCGECSLGCNVQAWKKGNQLLRLTPRTVPGVNEWWLCDKGRFGIHLISDEQRLKTSRKVGEVSADLKAEEVVASVTEEIRNLPEGRFGIVADSSMTNEEFFVLKELAKVASNARLYVPAREETRDVVKVVSGLTLDTSFPDSLEASKAALIVGEDIEKDHPVLALRLRRLVHTNGLHVYSVGTKEPVLSDVNRGHIPWNNPEEFWAETKENRGAAGSFWSVLKKAGDVTVFLSDQALSKESVSTIETFFTALSKKMDGKLRVSVLHQGANTRGLIDQWGPDAFSISDLETDIQRGKIEGLLWFGKAPESSIFHEYVRGMRIFVQFVAQKTDAHPAAKWILPLDLPPEKGGTYTNHFGRVQVLRKVRDVVAKGLAPLEFTRAVVWQLGGAPSAELAYLYEEATSGLSAYPRTVAEIPEVTATYSFYERAQCR